MKGFFFSILSLVVATPALVFAQGKVYTPLVNISEGNGAMSFEDYVNFLYGMSISIAALLAVMKIVIAGAKYMLSDVISNKSEAINDIQGAILGLLVIISAVIILELINPKLVKEQQTIAFPPPLTKAPEEKPPVTASPGDAGRQAIINETLGTNTPSTPPATNPFSGLTNIQYSSSGTTQKYTFDSSSWNNYPTTRFQKETEFKKRCADAGGSSSQNGANIFSCTITKAS